MEGRRRQDRHGYLASVQTSLGQRIRALRKQEGISQEELADRAELHWSYLARLERGELNPTLRNLVAVAAGLEVPLLEIFRFRGQALWPSGAKNRPPRQKARPRAPEP